MTQIEREELMTAQYGEVCTKATAGRILSRSTQTITAMLKDGRLDDACGGQMVDVRSIARYIMAPRAEDHRARMRKAGRKWAV